MIACSEPFCDTIHASLRRAQRHLSPEQVTYVIERGTRVHRTGVRFFVLWRRDIPAEDRRVDRLAKLVGTVAIVARDDTLVTVYKNPDAYREIRKKPKFSRPKPRPAATMTGRLTVAS